MVALPWRGVPRFEQLRVPALLKFSSSGFAILALGVFFLVTHVPFLSPTPGSIDSVNFLLGVRDFDVADHRPHPPGYPVFIALGKVSEAVVKRAWPANGERDAVRALAFWSALFGALAAYPLFQFFRNLELDDRRAVAATALTMTCPVFWFAAIRPMSDIPGLAAGLGAQAMLVTALRRCEARDPQQRGQKHAPAVAATASRSRVCQPMLVLGGLAAGVAIGVRSQNIWLTVPLLIWVVARCRVGLKSVLGILFAFSFGLMLWAVPLVVASGGLTKYAAALMAQGHADLIGADILATDPKPERLVRALVYTLAYPWANTGLAVTMFVLSLIGAGLMVRRSRGGAILIGMAAVPYGLFHLLFQEPVSTRYALPLLPAMAYLAVRGLEALASRAMPWLVAGLSAAGVLIALPPVVAFAHASSPVYQAINDIRSRVSREAPTPVLAMHHALARMLRGEDLPLRMLPSGPKHEWLELVKHWQQAPDTPVWFLAESGRNDLALVDPTSRRLVRSYTWPFRRKFLMSRMPKTGLDWYAMQPPGWMAGEGWSLSPEAAGVAWHDRQTPGDRSVVAFVRRRDEGTVLMVGGWNLSGSTGPTAKFELSIDQQPIDSWVVEPGPGSFLKTWELPAGILTGPGTYVPLRIRAIPTQGNEQALNVVIDQFDLQSQESVVYGFDSGWFQQEYDGAAPRPWRWTGPAATLRVHSAGRDLVLRVAGELPLKYLGRPPQITVSAGAEPLARIVSPEAVLGFEVRVPADALHRSGGFLRIETDRTFVPDEVIGNGDRRKLGLRVYELELRGVSDSS